MALLINTKTPPVCLICSEPIHSDEANHDWHGIFILNETGCRLGNLEKGYKEGLGIYDIAPTVLNLFGMKFDEETRGKSITQFEDRGIFTRLKNVWN